MGSVASKDSSSFVFVGTSILLGTNEDILFLWCNFANQKDKSPTWEQVIIVILYKFQNNWTSSVILKPAVQVSLYFPSKPLSQRPYGHALMLINTMEKSPKRLKLEVTLTNMLHFQLFNLPRRQVRFFPTNPHMKHEHGRERTGREHFN